MMLKNPAINLISLHTDRPLLSLVALRLALDHYWIPRVKKEFFAKAKAW